MQRRRTPVVVAGGVRHGGEHASRVRGVSGYPDLTMAVHTKHPASAPPAAPVREKTGHLMLRGWCIFVLFMALSGTAWLNAIGELPTAIMTIGGGLAVVRALVRRAPAGAVAASALVHASPTSRGRALSIIWSQWREATALTLLLLVITTLQGLFIGSVLTWRELVRAIASALKWVMALSLVFELWVSIFVGGPILPGFVIPTEPADDPIVYWSRDNLFDGGRIQGIMGNANLLGPVALLAIIVFSIRFAAGAPRRTLLGAWIGLSAYLFYRASSATAYVAAVAVAIVLVTVLLMRRARRPGERTRYYIAYAAVGLGGALAFWLLRDRDLHGARPQLRPHRRESDLAGGARARRAAAAHRLGILHAVDRDAIPRSTSGSSTTARRSCRRTTCGSTCSSSSALIGVFLMGVLYLAFVWRSWFFAVDRPRWDLRADRPYSPLTLLPTLVGADPARAGTRRVQPAAAVGLAVRGHARVQDQAVPAHRRGRRRDAHRDRAWRADHAGCRDRHAPRRCTPRAGSPCSRPPRSRARTRSSVLGAVFSAFAIEKIAGRVTYVTIIVGLCVLGVGMLIARRREISLVRLVPDDRGPVRGVGAGQRVLESGCVRLALELDRPRRVSRFLAVTIGHVRDTLQTARALGDVMRVLLSISLGVEVLAGHPAGHAVPLPRHPGQHRAARARSRASSARATCSASSRSSR